MIMQKLSLIYALKVANVIMSNSTVSWRDSIGPANEIWALIQNYPARKES